MRFPVEIPYLGRALFSHGAVRRRLHYAGGWCGVGGCPRGVGGAQGWLGWLWGAGFGSRGVQTARRGWCPLGWPQSVLRFEVRFNEIKWLQAKKSKRITLCLRGDTARRLSWLFARRGWVRLVMHGVPLVARQWSFWWTLPLASPCPPMPACSKRGCRSSQKASWAARAFSAAGRNGMQRSNAHGACGLVLNRRTGSPSTSKSTSTVSLRLASPAGLSLIHI